MPTDLTLRHNGIVLASIAVWGTNGACQGISLKPLQKKGELWLN